MGEVGVERDTYFHDTCEDAGYPRHNGRHDPDGSMGETCSAYMVEGERSTAFSDGAVAEMAHDDLMLSELSRVKDKCMVLMRRSVLHELCLRYLQKWLLGVQIRQTAKYFERHPLLRFLIDSRQVASHPSTLTEHATYSEPSHTPVAGKTQICWVPCDARQSYTFMLFPSRSRYAESSSWLWRRFMDVASFLLITGGDLYDLPLHKREGVILYEIPFSGVSGMDYSNNITSDGRWTIETREVYKWWFPTERALGDFLHHRIAPPAAVVLAAAVAAAVAAGPSHPLRHLRLLAESSKGGYDMLSLSGTSSPLVELSPANWSTSLDNMVTHPQHSYADLEHLALLIESSTGREAPEELPLRPTQSDVELKDVELSSLVHTNMVVLYFGDDSAPELPFSLWKVLRKPQNSEQLRLVESGLPSWTMFMSQRNIYYRTWIRSLVQTICIIWPIVTLVAALVDLYRSFETIRGLVHYIASGATYAEEVVLSCLGVAKSAVWYVFEPFVEYVWAALSDWWRSVVLTFVEDIGIVMSWVSWTLCSAWDFTTSIPLFTALAETKAYIVSMLLPYVADLAAACTTAIRLWVQVIVNMWNIMSGSAMAVIRVFTSVARVPKWFGNGLGNLFTLLQQMYQGASFYMLHLRTFGMNCLSLFKLKSSMDVTATVSSTAETAVRWSMMNSARQVIGNIISRTWNLTIFIGTEISKHWVTWVLRPFEEVLEWLKDNRTPIGKGITAFMPFGLISHVATTLQGNAISPNQIILRDMLIYAASLLATSAVYSHINIHSLMYFISVSFKPLLALVISLVLYELTQSLASSASFTQQCLVFSMTLLSGYIIILCAEYVVKKFTTQTDFREEIPAPSPTSSNISGCEMETALGPNSSPPLGPSPYRLRRRRKSEAVYQTIIAEDTAPARMDSLYAQTEMDFPGTSSFGSAGSWERADTWCTKPASVEENRSFSTRRSLSTRAISSARRHRSTPPGGLPPMLEALKHRPQSTARTIKFDKGD